MRGIDLEQGLTSRPVGRHGTDEQEPVGYEEMLRAIGHMLDTEGWSNICLREHDGGIQIMAQHAHDPAGAPVAFALGAIDLRAMVRSARVRRGVGRASALLAAADALVTPPSSITAVSA